MDRWMMARWMELWKGGCMCGLMNRWWMGGWMNSWMKGTIGYGWVDE